MKKRILLGIVWTWIFFGFGLPAWSEEVPYTLEDRDRLIRVETTLKEFKELVDERIEGVGKRIDNVDKRIDAIALDEDLSPRSSILKLRSLVSEVKRGAVVGIIGCNGAGKTTLLKILSQITKPTEDYAKIHGHLGSLLEVGTGFHPELTGRENIYLNGAILGMKKVEVERQFHKVVKFPETVNFVRIQ